jgi:hypothetical protein
MELMRKLLNWLFGWPLVRSETLCYVIVYDRAPPGAFEVYEEYYGYFSSPEEAHHVWVTYIAANANKFGSVKLCRVVEDWS